MGIIVNLQYGSMTLSASIASRFPSCLSHRCRFKLNRPYRIPACGILALHKRLSTHPHPPKHFGEVLTHTPPSLPNPRSQEHLERKDHSSHEVHSLPASSCLRHRVAPHRYRYSRSCGVWNLPGWVCRRGHSLLQRSGSHMGSNPHRHRASDNSRLQCSLWKVLCGLCSHCAHANTLGVQSCKHILLGCTRKPGG